MFARFLADFIMPSRVGVNLADFGLFSAENSHWAFFVFTPILENCSLHWQFGTP